MGQGPVAILTWDIAFKLGRVSNLPTVWTNSLAAIMLAGGALSDWRTLPLMVAMSLFYVGGMYLNDAFDADIDAAERPERPIPSGLVTRATIYAAGFGMLGLGTIVLLGISLTAANAIGYWPLLGGCTLAAMIIFYNWHHKTNPLSPLVMGLCRVLVYVTSSLCFVAALPVPLLLAALLLLSYLIGLTYLAKQETLGKVENLWPLLFLAAPIVYGASHVGAQPISAVFLLLFIAWIGVALWFVNRRQSGDIPRAVVSLIAGISLFDAVLIAGAGQSVIALLAVAGFGLTLILQRYVSGT